MQILDGKNLSLKENEEAKIELYNYIQTPILAIISIGKNDSNDIYINNKRKACEQVGISLLHFHYDEDIEEKTIIKKIKELNKDNSINGIIVQLPILKKYDVRKIINTIDPVKDVDALSDISMGKLMSGNNEFIPCTPRGILELLDYYKIPLESKNVVVIGRSDLVGKPIALECLKRNATVTLCHSYTKNLKEYTKNADILIVCVGKKYFIDKSMIKKDSVIIDVGINRVDGKIYGDVNPNVSEICSYLTPVPGGVGPMTVTMLLKNTVESYKIMNKKDNKKPNLD